MDQSLGTKLQTMLDETSFVVSNLVIATAVIGFAILLARAIRRFVQRRTTFRELPIVGQTIALNTISVLVGVAACTAILSVWGATWSAIATGIGLSTLAIALGLQDVLKSFAGGAVIFLERPFAIGDRIRIKDLTGEVVDVHVRHIVLRMDDGHLAMAPNGLLFTEPYENYSRTGDFAYAIIMNNIAGSSHEAKSRIHRALANLDLLSQTPEVLLQRDLRSAIPWPLRGGENGAGQSRPGHRHVAVISWNSDTEETAISEMVQKLQTTFPEAGITVRRR